MSSKHLFSPVHHSPLIKALNDKNIKEAKTLILYGADLNAKGTNENTVLHICAVSGFAEIATLALERGADPNAWNKLKETPLMYSVFCAHPDIAKALLQKGANPNVYLKNNEPLFHHACLSDNLELVQLLLSHVADPCEKDGLGYTAMHMPAFGGGQQSSDIIRLLISEGLNVNEENKDGATPLCVAFLQGVEETVRTFLAHGATWDVPSKTNPTQTWFDEHPSPVFEVQALYDAYKLQKNLEQSIANPFASNKPARL